MLLTVYRTHPSVSIRPAERPTALPLAEVSLGCRKPNVLERLVGRQGMPVRIKGNVWRNFMAAVGRARRWKGRAFHKDTADHWLRLLDYDRQLHGEAVDDLRDLQADLKRTRVERR